MAENVLSSGRRLALRVVGGVLASVMGIALITPSLIFLSDPLRRRKAKGKGMTPGLKVAVAQVDELPDLDAGKEPLRAAVVATGLSDAWNRLENTRLGSVFLGKRQGGVSCLSATCPHAGCGIDFDEKRREFVCPCHNSVFSIDGKRKEGPSPRDMDELAVTLEGDTVYCEFQRFRLADKTKVPV